MKKEIQSRQKVFINLKLSTMRTFKLIVMTIMTLVVGCQKFEQNNTDNPKAKDPTEQQGSDTNNGNRTDKNDKGNKPDDQQRVEPNPTPSFATGWVPVKKNSKYASVCLTHIYQVLYLSGLIERKRLKCV